MKYYCDLKGKLSKSRIESIKLTYPRIKFVYSIDEINSKLIVGDSVVFDSILDLDDVNKNDIDRITDNYMELYQKKVDLVFDRSPNCDSAIIEGYLSRFSEIESRKYFGFILEMQIQSYINIKDASANFKKNSQKIASRDEGKSYGRPKGTTVETEKAKKAKEIIKKYSKDFNGKLSDDECIKKSGASRNMFYIYKRQLKKEMAE